MKRHTWTVIAAISVFLAGGFSASPQTLDEINGMMQSRICPAELVKYRTISWEKGCGKNFYAVNEKMRVCRLKVDETNRAINAYNEFIGKCHRAARARANPQQNGQSGGKWANRLKQAESRNQSRSGDEQKNTAAYRSGVDGAFQRKRIEDDRKFREFEEQQAREAREQLQRDLRQHEENQRRERAKIPQQQTVIGTDPAHRQASWYDELKNKCPRPGPYMQCTESCKWDPSFQSPLSCWNRCGYICFEGN